jgi:hypothetical protein
MITQEHTRNKVIRYCRLLGKSVDKAATCGNCQRECQNEGGKDMKRDEGHKRHIIVK